MPRRPGRRCARAWGTNGARSAEGQIAEIVNLVLAGEGSAIVKIFDTTDFGYRKVTVERPLRLNFSAAPERLEQLREQSAFRALGESKKKDGSIRAIEEAAGREEQERILAALRALPESTVRDRVPLKKNWMRHCEKHG